MAALVKNDGGGPPSGPPSRPPSILIVSRAGLKPLKTFIASHPDDNQSRPSGGPLHLTYSNNKVVLIPCVVGVGSYENESGESVEYLEGIRPDVGNLYEEHNVRGVVIISKGSSKGSGSQHSMVPAVVEQIKSVVKGFAAGAGAGAASAGAAGVADCFELVEDVEGIWNFLRMNKYVGSLEEEEEEDVAEDEEGDDDNYDNDVNDNNDEEQQAERERPTSLYKCHTCRTTLFDSTSVSPHNPTCNSIHIVHPNPLTKDVGYTPNSGKLYCFKCKNKVGSYNWSGVKCACKHWWQGGCTVNKSSVDEEDVKVVLQGVEKLVLKESSEGAGKVDVKVVVSRDVVRSQEEVAAEKKGQQEKGGFRHDRGKSKPKHPTHKNFGKKDSSIGSFA